MGQGDTALSAKLDTATLLSRRTQAVDEAAIAKMSQRARDLTAQGRDIISLALGEPDFDTPKHIREAATAAMDAGYTHYAPIAGFPDLRKAIADKLAHENDLSYSAAEIVLTNGAKQAITNLMFALLDEGDEVVVLGPCWASYDGIIRMAGGTPVHVTAGLDQGFKAPVSRIAAAIGPRTKAVMFNSPCNPTGAMWTRPELQAIADLVLSHPSLVVISDEIYEYIAFDEEHISIGSLPGMSGRTIIINGFSKGFAMTGWRLGYLAAPEPIARAAAKVQSNFTAGANAFVQRAALAALEGSRQPCIEMRDHYHRRRDMVAGRLRTIPGLRTLSPAGTFYIFPDVSALYGRKAGNHLLTSSTEFCDWLLDIHGLSTIPGIAFGDDSCIRLSFAASDEALARAMDRLEAAIASLGKPSRRHRKHNFSNAIVEKSSAI